jgi:hypothetical protein
MLVVCAALGLACGAEHTVERDAAGELDAAPAPDAWEEAGGPSSDDAAVPLDAPAETWSIDRATAEYCEPLAEAECAARRTCPCAIDRPCDPALLVATCRAELEAGTTGDRTLDGRWLASARAAEEDRWTRCIPPLRRELAPWRVPSAAFVQPVGLAMRCASSVRPDVVEGCAGGDGACVDFTCAPRGEARSPCRDEVLGQCRPGLHCDGGRCAPLGGEGAGCDPTAPDETSCIAGLLCVDGACLRPRAAGEACGEAPCGPCLRCEDGSCVEATACELALGEGCGLRATCGRGTCVERAGLGEACDDRDCEVGLGCLLSTLTCARMPAPGEPCAEVVGPGCGPDAICEGGTCRALPAEGEACTGTCAGGLVCASGACVRRAADGEPCDVGCANGTCGAGGLCEPWPGSGEPCGDGACTDPLACGLGDRCVAPLGGGCAAGVSWRECGSLTCAIRAECGW